jgi:acyl-CoA synthetase (AMP-forming)/AMP-acid ligase II
VKQTRIVDIVGDRAHRQPERVALTFHGPGDKIEELTYGELAHEAGAYAAAFVRRGLPPESLIVILAPSVRGFVSAFIGAQQAGLVAVPAPSPELLGPQARYRERLLDIVRQSRAAAVFSPIEQSTDVLRAELAAGGVSFITPAVLSEAADEAPAGRYCSLAYCQFTSGSGGRAKGVLLTHDNVLANIQARQRAHDLGPDDVGVSWLPFSHDMGLVGYVLFPLATGMPCHVMSPQAFLADPRSWLALITRVRGTVANAPNSAYGLCARRVADSALTGLDLASWRRAFNGAEPVTVEVVEAFARRFASVGFDGSAMLPAYGLAENTLSVSSRRVGQGARFDVVSRDALEDASIATPASPEEFGMPIASVGAPLPGEEVAILDADGRPCDERRVGEIAVRSASVMHGYLQGTEGEGGLGSDGWLLTGDLGYMADGELFVAGRKKDLIVRAGRKYYPQDLEDAAGRVPGVRTGRVVAFAVAGPEVERVVVVAERREGAGSEPEALCSAIRQALFTAVRFQPDDVVLVPAQTLPLTTSGKVMRPAARRSYVEGQYAATR